MPDTPNDLTRAAAVKESLTTAEVARSGAVPAGLVLNAPERIYLNVGDLLRPTEFVELQRSGEVSWCDDSIDAHDVAYVRADIAAAPEPPQGDELHPATRDLVNRFAAAMADKLLAAQRKYGYSDGWTDPGWMDECRAHLLQHIAKGDPRDVANYCAFLWHHGASTAGADTPRSGDAPVAWMSSWLPDKARVSGQTDGRVYYFAPTEQRARDLVAGLPGVECAPLYTAPPADARDGEDAKRLDFIACQYLEITPFNMPGPDDVDVGWRVYEFDQSPPHKRLVAEQFSDDLRAAIDSAMGAGGLS